MNTGRLVVGSLALPVLFTVALAQAPQPLPVLDDKPSPQVDAGGPSAAVTVIAFGADGEALYAAGLDKRVRVWTLNKGRFVLKTEYRVPIGPGNAGALNAVALSPDGAWVAMAGRAPIRSRLARAEYSSAAALSSTPLGSPVDPEVAITAAVPGRSPAVALRRAGPSPGVGDRLGGMRSVPWVVSMVAGARALSRAATLARGRPGSTGRIAGPLPSSAAASRSISRPAPDAGGSSTACRGRPVTVVRLTGQIRHQPGGPGVIDWQRTAGQEYTDIGYETAEGIAKITINRPEVRNAFRPTTLFELSDAFTVARDDPEIGVIILTGAGTQAFCSGGDQKIRGDDGYVDDHGVGRLNVLDLQVQIRRTPKPVIAMVAGYAVGGGHVLHVCCDLTIAADNAIFGQTGPKVGSFDGGYGSWLLASTVGLKKAREIWYLCRQYDAQQALEMGLVNTVVPLASLEEETITWARELLAKSPLALRMLKGALNAVTDGAAGMQQFAGDATLLYYMSEEAQEGRDAFKERRTPDFAKFPRRP